MMKHNRDSTALLSAYTPPKTLAIYAENNKTARDFIAKFEKCVKLQITEKTLKYETHSDDYQDQVSISRFPRWSEGRRLECGIITLQADLIILATVE